MEKKPMDTLITTPRTSIYIDDAVQLSLERHTGNGIRIIVLPPPGHADASLRQVQGARSLPAQDPDDELANATWEDAEWR
jgi:hypothetical protein